MGKFIHRYSYTNPKPKKTAGVVRYGGFGDVIQASSLLPLLKAQGYHLTFYTVPAGFEILKHDPHIDRFIVQDKDQVPGTQLLEFFDYTAKKYDKFINLCESVEATWLALPGRSNHGWNKTVKAKYMNTNYLEFTHELADLPYKPSQKFYPAADETAWARRERNKMGGGSCIVWSLSGSSVHKTWPYLDTIIARLLISYPDCRIVTVGDPMCQMLECGWENEPRVIKRSGVWSIRETLTFINHADMVVGPETGVLNAAAFLSVPKIITLSHSSHENLTRDWVNCTVLTPKNTPCYPCHLMHFGFEHCVRDEESGTAACQADISADQFWNAMTPLLEKAA
jgi:ADP-heptose:LPS heptosyltransferase